MARGNVGANLVSDPTRLKLEKLIRDSRGTSLPLADKDKRDLRLRVTSSTVTSYGYPAIRIVWDNANEEYVDLDDVTVYVTSPNGNAFGSGDKVRATFLGVHPGGGGQLLYEAAGRMQSDAVRLIPGAESPFVTGVGSAVGNWLIPAILQSWNGTTGLWEDTDPPVYVLTYRPGKHSPLAAADDDIPLIASFVGIYNWTVSLTDYSAPVYQIDQAIIAGGGDTYAGTAFIGSTPSFSYDLSTLNFSFGMRCTGGGAGSGPSGGVLDVGCVPATPNNPGMVSYYDSTSYNGSLTSRMGPLYQWLGKGTKGVDELMVGSGGSTGYIYMGITPGGGSGGTPADSYYSGQLASASYVSGGNGGVTLYGASRAYFEIGQSGSNGTATLYTSGTSSAVNYEAKTHNFSSVPEGITDGSCEVDVLGSIDCNLSGQTHFLAANGDIYLKPSNAGPFDAVKMGSKVYSSGGTTTCLNYALANFYVMGALYTHKTETTEAGFLAASVGQDLASGGTDYFVNGILIASALPPVALGTSGAGGVSGTLGVANGGTGVGTLASGKLLYGNGTGAIQAAASVAINGSGQLELTTAGRTISFTSASF